MMSSTMISGAPVAKKAPTKKVDILFREGMGSKDETLATQVEEPVSDCDYDEIFDADFEENEWTNVKASKKLKTEDQSRNYIICQDSQSARTQKQIIKEKVQTQITENAKTAAKASAPYFKAGIDYVTEGAMRLVATETADGWLRGLKGVVDKAVDTVTVIRNQSSGGAER